MKAKRILFGVAAAVCLSAMPTFGAESVYEGESVYEAEAADEAALSAYETVVEDGIKYTLDRSAGTAYVSGYETGITVADIKASVDGCVVTMVSGFGGCKTLEKAIIPSSVKTINSNAFYNCQVMTEVKLNNGLETIGSNAFQNCINLESIDVPQTVTSIGNGAFEGCTYMEKADISKAKLSKISNSLFSDCEMLEDIKLPTTYTEIGSYAFKGTAIKEIIFHEKVNYLNDCAFEYCRSLETVRFLGNAPGSWGKYVFSGTPDDIKFLFTDGKKGWTTPKWKGYDCYAVNPYASEGYKYGDADANGKVNAADSAAILQKALNSSYKMPIEEKTEHWSVFVDTDHDGTTNAADSAAVLQKALISTFEMPVESYFYEE